VEGAGRGLGGLRIDLYLAPKSDNGEGARAVGHALSDDRGRFDTRVELPRDLDLTAYEIFAATPGDKTWQPSISK